MKYFYFLLTLFFLFGNIQAQVKEPWDFPVMPGTSAWEAFTTHKEILKSLQIPKSELNSMSTEELLIICFRYPMWIDMHAYDNAQEGFERVFNGFNGLQELVKRNDLEKALLKFYPKIDDISYLNSLKFKHPIPIFIRIEMFLSQENILNKMSKKGKMSLLKSARDHHGKKMKQLERYSINSRKYAGKLMGKILKKLNKNPKNVFMRSSINKFIVDGNTYDESILDDIYQATNHLIEEED